MVYYIQRKYNSFVKYKNPSPQHKMEHTHTKQCAIIKLAQKHRKTQNVKTCNLESQIIKRDLKKDPQKKKWQDNLEMGSWFENHIIGVGKRLGIDQQGGCVLLLTPPLTFQEKFQIFTTVFYKV